MAKSSYDATPGLRRLINALRGAIDDFGGPDPVKRKKQVFDEFFSVMGKDEEHLRDVWRFWFEQAYPATAKQQAAAWKKKKPAASKKKSSIMAVFTKQDDGTHELSSPRHKAAPKKRYRLELSKEKPSG